jgi:hypothetical protein
MAAPHSRPRWKAKNLKCVPRESLGLDMHCLWHACATSVVGLWGMRLGDVKRMVLISTQRYKGQKDRDY